MEESISVATLSPRPLFRIPILLKQNQKAKCDLPKVPKPKVVLRLKTAFMLEEF